MNQLNFKILGLIVLLCTFQVSAQNKTSSEKYGNTLNVGLGLGYYGYAPYSMPVLHFDYEFDVAKSFTLAPFISYYSFHSQYYWGNKNTPYRYYNYRQTVVPVGVKGTYYLDNLLKLNSKWDIYAAGSLGVAIIKSRWDNGYDGNRTFYRNSSSGTTPLFLDVHLGAEYRINSKAGIFLDLSTGVSTIGLAVHF